MKHEDVAAYVERYEERLSRFGYSPATLGWGKGGRQDVRFGILADPAVREPGSSVLDVGCGFADLHDFLVHRGWSGRYRGIDLVPGLVAVARERHPQLDVRVLQLADCAPEEQFDYVIASGVFNAKLQAGGNEEHIASSLAQMFTLAKKAVCVDFLSTHVEYRHEIAWHTDIGWLVSVIRRLTRRFQIRHDYMPFEFAALLFRNDAFSSRSVFEAGNDQAAMEVT